MMDKEYLLQILIPTYNREKFLRHNLEMLAGYITTLEMSEEISVIVSDNHSTDDTMSSIRDLQHSLGIPILINQNDRNLGPEQNMVNVLRYATAKYVMYLGDDDYLSFEYLREVIHLLVTMNLSCIIPSNVPISIEGNQLPGGRDIGLSSCLLKQGSKSAVEAFYRGHQLSGVTFLRQGTLDVYIEYCPRNMYPFMFFVGFNTLRGDVYHLTEYPVKVTQPPEGGKDWGYGDDGLAIDRFKNSYGLFHDEKKIQYLAEKKLIRINNSGFFLFYLKKGLRALLRYCSSIIGSSYVTINGKLYFIVFSIYQLANLIARKLLKKFRKGMKAFTRFGLSKKNKRLG